VQELSSLVAIVVAMTLGAMSPGPSFVMVTRTAASQSRADGLYAALGMGLGGLMFAIASLAGLHGLLVAVPSLYWILKVAGGCYLAYLGVRIWLAAKQPLATSPTHMASRRGPAVRSLLLGFTTHVSNPKAALIYTSVFAAFLPADTSFAFKAAVAIAVFCVEFSWYAVVALVLSASGPRNAYLRFRRWVDRAAGGIMVTLGLKLISSAGRSV
jgi:threonine/homoserine/homoserine lactone efflux protein